MQIFGETEIRTLLAIAIDEANIIRELRKENKVTQDDLAGAVVVTRQTIIQREKVIPLKTLIHDCNGFLRGYPQRRRAN